MSYLHKFPFDAIKINQTFIQTMLTSEWSMEIVKTIITMAHNLKLDVIGEGVETVEQLEELKKLGSDYYQGYLYSKPLNSEQAKELIYKNLNK